VVLEPALLGKGDWSGVNLFDDVNQTPRRRLVMAHHDLRMAIRAHTTMQ
jgi:hypothetical protein